MDDKSKNFTSFADRLSEAASEVEEIAKRFHYNKEVRELLYRTVFDLHTIERSVRDYV